MSCERTQARCPRVHHLTQGLKDAIVEPLFTYLIPAMRHRLQCRTIGRLGDAAHRRRDLQGLGGVPTGSIALPHDAGGRHCLGDMRAQEMQHGGVRRGQNYCGHDAPRGRPGRIGVHVLPHHLSGGLGAHPWRCPAAFGRTSAAATAFIWGHHEDRARIIGWAGLNGGFASRRKVFLTAAGSAAVASGGFARGASFRQPWRANSR
jgi:hypothetical protein